MEGGRYENKYGNSNHRDASGTFPGNTFKLHNVRNTGYKLNQGVLSFGKNLDTQNGWDIGGRVDFMFGTDANDLQSQGLEYKTGHRKNKTGNHAGGRWGYDDYYSALAQTYIEAGYKNFKLKFGKFLNPMGHEGVFSPDRFFFSLTEAYYILPKTQTGVLLSYDLNSKFSIFGGWSNGFTSMADLHPNGDDLSFDTSRNDAFLFGLRYNMSKRFYLKYAGMTGSDTAKYTINSINKENDRHYFVQSFIVGSKLGQHWDYTFEWILRSENNKGNSRDDDYGARGINQELIYTINDQWSVGGRWEWLYCYNKNHHLYTDNKNFEKFVYTGGINWKPFDWLLIRPEIRYDKYHRNTPFQKKNGPSRNTQLSGGVSVVVKF